MKKIMAAIMVSAFVITLGGTTAFAVGRGRQESTSGIRQYSTDYTGQGAGAFFTDADGDGICDYRNTSGISGVCPYLEDSVTEEPAVEEPAAETPAVETPAVEYRHHLRCAGIGDCNGAGNGTCNGTGYGAGYGHHGNR